MVIVRNLIMVANAEWAPESFVHPLAHLLGALSAIVSAHLRLYGGGEAFRYMERLEVRNEQLLAEKERLLYDVQRGVRPLDDDDDRSAIRRGLQAGHAPTASPPPSLPPGAPSSTAGSSTVDVEQAAHQLVQLLRRPSTAVGPSDANGEAGGQLSSAAAKVAEEAPAVADATAPRVGEVSEAGEVGADEAGEGEHSSHKRRRPPTVAAGADAPVGLQQQQQQQQQQLQLQRHYEQEQEQQQLQQFQHLQHQLQHHQQQLHLQLQQQQYEGSVQQHGLQHLQPEQLQQLQLQLQQQHAAYGSSMPQQQQQHMQQQMQMQMQQRSSTSRFAQGEERAAAASRSPAQTAVPAQTALEIFDAQEQMQLQQQMQQMQQMQMQMQMQQRSSTSGFAQGVQPQDEEAAAASHAPSGSPAHDDAQSSTTVITTVRTFEQVLQTALHGVQVAQTDADVQYAVRKLALALGAVRTEMGTIKALHAVLLQLIRPDMSAGEMCTLTGASNSNFSKWRKRVHDLRLQGHVWHSHSPPSGSSAASRTSSG